MKPLVSVYRPQLEKGLSYCDARCEEFDEQGMGELKIKISLREGRKWEEAACIKKASAEKATV